METFGSGLQKYCDDLDESVYPLCDSSKASRYRSRFAKKVRVDMWCKKSGCYSTMGPPRIYAERPEHFLRKHTSSHPVFIDPLVLRNPEAELVTRTNNCYKPKYPRTMPSLIPPLKIVRGQRDFLEENALHVIRMVPRRMKRCYKGADGSHRVDLSDGPFVLRPGFGQIPAYLEKRKWELYCEGQRLKEEMMEAQVPPNYRVMSHCERCSLVEGLRSRWEELTTEYLRLPSYVSESLDKKKSVLVNQLKEIEADLRLLNTSGPVYVTEGDDPNNLH